MAASQPALSRRDSILAATVRLFSDQGYLATTIRDIAGAVGLLPGSLYVHIESKELLLLELVEDGIDRFLVVCEPAAESAAAADVRLREVIAAFIAVAAAEPELTLVALHQWKHLTGPGRTRVMEKRRRFEHIFLRLIEEGIETGAFRPGLSPRVAVLMIIGALNWAPEWVSAQGPATREQIGEEFADIVLNGVARGGGAGA